MKKDIRSLIYQSQETHIRFQNVIEVQKFINYLLDCIEKSNIVFLKDILKYLHIDYNFYVANRYGWLSYDLYWMVYNYDTNKIQNSYTFTLPIPAHRGYLIGKEHYLNEERYS